MTAGKLTLTIVAALVLQILAVVALVLWKRARAAVALNPGSESMAKSLPGWTGWHDLRVIARTLEDAAGIICSFTLQATDGGVLPGFLPGQYLNFQVRTGPEEKERVRCYSLSAIGDDRTYRISIKRAPWNRELGSHMPISVYFHEHVQVGDTVKVRTPTGGFTLDVQSPDPIVLIAGGIGITPLLTMLQWLLVHQPKRSVHLFYGARNSREMAFRKDIDAWASRHPQFSRHLVFDTPDPGDSELPGCHEGRFITTALLQQRIPHGRAQFYLCGPNAMMKALTEGLRAWGVPEQDVHLESFGPSALAGARPAAETSVPTAFQIAFSHSGISAEWDGRDANLLDFSERSGVDIASACRAGNCGTCETKIRRGAVVYQDAPEFPVRDAYCLPCVCRPAGDLVLEA